MALRRGRAGTAVGGDLTRPGTVVIVGVGLIGGSVGLALRARGAAGRVVGVDLDAANLRRALDLGAIDAAAPGLAEAAADAEVVVVAAPVTATVPLVREAARVGGESLLITDVGSTKARIVAEVEADPRARARFVASHPIAGSERQGAGHARADLFGGRVVALTPTDRTPTDRVERARAFWRSLGATPWEVDPVAHDAHLALTSHLPHAVASALAAVVPPDLFPLAAGAYRDGTRVAGADAALWAGIFLDNRRPLLDALAAFEGRAQAFRAALEAGDPDRLRAWWRLGQGRRTGFGAGAPADPDPGPVDH